MKNLSSTEPYKRNYLMQRFCGKELYKSSLTAEFYKNKFYLKKLCRKELVLLSILSLFLFLLPFSKSLGAIQIDINTAPLEDLVKIIHIGEKRALELISLRPFSSLDDLIKIKGIAEARVQDIKKQGIAWIVVSQIEKIEPAEVNPAGVGSLKIYPMGIVINEILPSPEGPDNLEEWIELKNINNEEVDLYKWKIQDTTGSVTAYTFSEGTKIGPKGFLVLSRPTTKITLNNSGDELNLIHPNGNILDTVTYEKAPRGQSYNRTEAGWLWNTILTPGAVNIVSVSSQTEKIEFPKEELKEIGSEKEIKEDFSKMELAAIGEQISTPSKSLYIFLIALSLAFLSGAIILVLKRKKN